MSNRIEKVNSLLKQEISKIVARDFDFSGMLATITHVETSGNLIEAKVYVSVLPNEKTDQVINLLHAGVYGVQQKMNKTLNMRPIPKIIFTKDRVIAEAAKIEAILSSLKKEEK